MTSIDYVISTFVFISTFIIFYSYLSNIMDANSSDIISAQLASQSNIIYKALLLDDNITKNISYSKIKLAEANGSARAEQIILTMIFLTPPKNIKFYGDGLQRLDATVTINGNIASATFSKSFLPYENFTLLAVWEEADSESISCNSCVNQNISFAAFVCSDCRLYPLNFSAFNYTAFREKWNIKNNFGIKIENMTYGLIPLDVRTATRWAFFIAINESGIWPTKAIIDVW